MSAPVRVQLSRSKGWRMPANTVSVARPTIVFDDADAILATLSPPSVIDHAQLEQAAQRIAEAAGAHWPQDADRYRRYARAALQPHNGEKG